VEREDAHGRHFRQMTRLAEQPRGLPAQILDHRYTPEAFGSWSLTVRSSGRLFRIVVEGRDRERIVEHSHARHWLQADWSPLARTALDGDGLADPGEHILQVLRAARPA